MIIKLVKYMCTKCAKEFNNEYEARDHESKCEEDPCNSCACRYYRPDLVAYTCGHESECGASYDFYIKKEDNDIF